MLRFWMLTWLPKKNGSWNVKKAGNVYLVMIVHVYGRPEEQAGGYIGGLAFPTLVMFKKGSDLWVVNLMELVTV